MVPGEAASVQVGGAGRFTATVTLAVVLVPPESEPWTE